MYTCKLSVENDEAWPSHYSLNEMNMCSLGKHSIHILKFLCLRKFIGLSSSQESVFFVGSMIAQDRKKHGGQM